MKHGSLRFFFFFSLIIKTSGMRLCRFSEEVPRSILQLTAYASVVNYQAEHGILPFNPQIIVSVSEPRSAAGVVSRNEDKHFSSTSVSILEICGYKVSRLKLLDLNAHCSFIFVSLQRGRFICTGKHTLPTATVHFAKTTTAAEKKRKKKEECSFAAAKSTLQRQSCFPCLHRQCAVAQGPI